MLSKTDFVTGLQCPLALWLRKHDRSSSNPLDSAQALRFAAGDLVDEVAREEYPGGVLVSSHGLVEAAAETSTLIGLGTRRIYQATVASAAGGCMVDVLDVHADGAMTLREVKSATSVGTHHVLDLAFQYFAFQSAGHWIERAYIVHLNPEAQPASRFVEVDVTEQVIGLLPSIQVDAKRLSAVTSGARPNVAIGSRCREPYPCPFTNVCWVDVPTRSVFTVPGLSRKRLDAAIAAGHLDAIKLPAARLPRAAREYVARLSDGESLDASLLDRWCATLVEPVSLLEFIGYRPPVSNQPGSRPYSLSVCAAGLSHSGGSYEVYALPGVVVKRTREDAAFALLEGLGDIGSVVVWDREYALEGLRFLRHAAPSLGLRLRNVEMRLVSIQPLVGEVVRHPDFLALTSVDAVARVVTPGVDVPSVSDLILQVAPADSGLPPAEGNAQLFASGLSRRLDVLARMVEIARTGSF